MTFSVLDRVGNLKQTSGAPASSAPTTTGTQTALAIPSGTGPLTLYLNNASLLTVQGIAAGIADQLLFVFSKGAGQVDFAHNHASGTALGKLKLFATSGLTSLAAGSGVAVFQYDGTATIWRLVAHQQGAAISVPFNAADFTADGVGAAWTVDAADVARFKYVLDGRKLTVWLNAGSTTLVATPDNLNIALPAGFTVNGAALTTAADFFNSNTAVGEAAIAYALASKLIIYRISFTAFPTLTNLADVHVQTTFEVT